MVRTNELDRIRKQFVIVTSSSRWPTLANFENDPPDNISNNRLKKIFISRCKSDKVRHDKCSLLLVRSCKEWEIFARPI